MKGEHSVHGEPLLVLHAVYSNSAKMSMVPFEYLLGFGPSVSTGAAGLRLDRPSCWNGRKRHGLGWCLWGEHEVDGGRRMALGVGAMLAKGIISL